MQSKINTLEPDSLGQKLVIVESPAKVKTISKILGNGFQVIASVGHVRDLPKRKIGVYPDKDFQADYEISEGSEKIVSEIRKVAKNSSQVFLATDPDREGEAIAWHVVEAAKIPKKLVKRIVFHSITKNAVEKAFESPRDIDMQLVNAQAARRHIDRLIGYQVSPVLAKIIQKGASGGRVQSPTVRLVVERDKEIDNFNPVEYWTIIANLLADDAKKFDAQLVHINGRAIKKPGIRASEEVRQIQTDLTDCHFVTKSVKETPKKQSPSAPFITTTLQREASTKLGFDPERTMSIAQQLYEGVNGSEGLITYMRTDSIQVDQGAINETREYISGTWGAEYLPASPRVHKGRANSAVAAQEAHEAIRPTSVGRTPENVSRQYRLKSDQFKIYDLIWKRMIASQMVDEIGSTTAFEIEANHNSNRSYLFRKSIYVPKFLGFAILYKEDEIDINDESEGEDRADEVARDGFPALTMGQEINFIDSNSKQSSTKPPARYSQATLIKALEERGIGRPSTYASTVKLVISKSFVRAEDRRLSAEIFGCRVIESLERSFPSLIDYDFTARLEEDLDEIASGKYKYLDIMERFYRPFKESVDAVRDNISDLRSPIIGEPPGLECPDGHPLEMRWARGSWYYRCESWPTHKYSRPIELPEVIDTGVSCRMPSCGGHIVVKIARRTRREFYACSNYPTCNFSTGKRPLIDPCPICEGILVEGLNGQAECISDCLINNAVPCPTGNCNGVLLQRRGRFGPFWGCNQYPDCKTIVNKKPLHDLCPTCGGLTVCGTRGIPQCHNRDCGWKGETTNENCLQ